MWIVQWGVDSAVWCGQCSVAWIVQWGVDSAVSGVWIVQCGVGSVVWIVARRVLQREGW